MKPRHEQNPWMRNANRHRESKRNFIFVCFFHIISDPGDWGKAMLEGRLFHGQEGLGKWTPQQTWLPQVHGPFGTRSSVLRQLVDTMDRPLLIISERSWGWREVSEDWTIANVTPVYKRGKKEDPRTAGLLASPQSLQMDGKKVIRNSHHGFTPNQIYCLLRWNNYLEGWGESNEYCLFGL